MATPTLPTAKRPAAPAKQKNNSTSIVSILATAGGAALGAALVRGLPPTAAARLLGGAIMGLLVGLLPWLLGKRKGQERLGKQGLGWCAVAGTAFGLLLAGPVALGFTAVILRRAK